MEQDAPNQVIGKGSLEVEPKMQAVHEELDRINKTFDMLKEKGATVFDGMLAKIKEAGEEVAALIAKAAELKIELPSEPSPQAPEERRDPRIPLPNSPEADARIDDAEDNRWKEEVLTELRRIATATEEELNRDPE